MPRGRRRSPQESIDSILLALCRRNDIDPETLSHYFDRLDEEWTEGAREKVMGLLRSNDPAVYAASVLILSELAADSDLEDLEDLVADPMISDMAKIALAPVLKELGSEMADDGLLEYLNDPARAMQQMQTRLLEMVGESEMGIESILEDVLSMPVEKRLAFIGWLGASNDPRSAKLLIPLLDNPSSKVVAAAIEALEQLEAVASQQAIPALNHLLANSANRTLKQQARATLGRLMMHSLPGAEETAMREARRSQLPPYQARVSYIDGSGSQLILLSWQRLDGTLKGFNILYQDQWGIKDCYGIDEMQKSRWDELISELEKQGFGSFQVPFEYACALAMQARSVNKRTRHKIPVAYSVWRSSIETRERKRDEFLTKLEPLPMNQEMVELAQQGDKLYQKVEFFSWIYEPIDQLEPYVHRYWDAYSQANPNAPGKRVRAKKNKQVEQVQHQALEALVSQALSELVHERWRTIYSGRLLRQAALFQLAGREEDAQLAQAVATVLATDSPVPVEEQAFPRAMMRLSLEQGPLRMMMESLNSSGFLPVNFFDGE